MTAHHDILDEREPLGKQLAGSVGLHMSVAAVLLLYSVSGSRSHLQIGDPHGGGMGAVAVNTVATIPLPARSGPTNPVANHTESAVPAPPPKPKAQKKVAEKPPPPNAIALKSSNALRRPAPAASAPDKWRQQQRDLPNQVYSNAGQAINSPLFGKTGSGGVGIGNNSPFGTQFGFYATMLQQKIAGNWRTGDVDPRISTAPAVVVTFIIRRDGSVAPGSVKVVQTSGVNPLDISAQRAILDSAPFNPLPPGFPRDQADIELRFELRR